MNSSKISKQFPALSKKIENKRIIYFDNACSILKPKPVIKAMKDYSANYGSCSGNRSSHHLSWQTQELVEETREEVKRFINAASAKEIIWTRNTTEGINLIASSFPFKKNRNEVLITLLEHHSNILPFYEQSQRRGFKLKVIPINKDGSLDLDLLTRSITNKTALVAITHLSNVTGLVYPVRKIAKIAHKKGAKILVDDAQFVASHSENVKKNDIDFMVFSGHKIGAPTGIGVLYVKKTLLKGLLPYNVGGGTVQSVKVKGKQINVKYLTGPARFEAGIQDYLGIVGLKAAVDFIKSHNQNKITRYIESLAVYAFQKLNKIPEVKFLADYNIHKPSSLISFNFHNRKYSLYDFNLFLNHELKDYYIAVRCGHHCAQPLHSFLGLPISMRLSFFIYNNKNEIDIFVNALHKFLNR